MGVYSNRALVHWLIHARIAVNLCVYVIKRGSWNHVPWIRRHWRTGRHNLVRYHGTPRVNRSPKGHFVFPISVCTAHPFLLDLIRIPRHTPSVYPCHMADIMAGLVYDNMNFVCLRRTIPNLVDCGSITGRIYDRLVCTHLKNAHPGPSGKSQIPE